MIDLNQHVLAPWLYRGDSVDIEALFMQIKASKKSNQKLRGYVIAAFAMGTTRPLFGLDWIKTASAYLPEANDLEAAQLVMAQAYCLTHTRRFDEMYQVLSANPDLLERIEAAEWKIYGRHLLAVASLHTNRFAQALENAKKVIATSYSHDLQPLRGRSLSVVGVVAGELGMHLEAAKFFERARCASIAQAETALPAVLDTNNVAWNLCLVAEERIDRGRTEDATAATKRAIALAQEAIGFAQRIKSLRQEVNAVETLAAAYLLHRDIDAARKQLHRLDELVKLEVSDSVPVTRGVVTRANLEVEEGNFSRAIEWLEKEYAAARQSGRLRLHRSLLRALENAYVKAGNFKEGYAVSLEARAILQDSLRGNSEALLQTLIRNISARHQDWLAYISHDLRSPISNIIAVAQTSSAENAAANLERVRGLGEMAISSLNRYLDFARLDIESGDLKDVELNELLEQALDSVSPKIAVKRLSVKLQSPDLIVINGDWDLLLRAFTNLLENAVAAAPEGTALGVSLHPWNEACILKFENEGNGFESGAIAELFDVKPRTRGSRRNLGLPIAAFVVEMHRGSLSLRNRPEGTGVCVTVVLPRVLPDVSE